MPNLVRAQEAVTFKFQSTWPAKDIFHEFAADLVSRVNEMAGGKLKIELLAAGSVAKAFEVQDAVTWNVDLQECFGTLAICLES